MYNCKKCGVIEGEWCNKCEEIVDCDCTDMTYTRFKDLTYDTENGEKTVTIRLHHCGTCGEINHAEI